MNLLPTHRIAGRITAIAFALLSASLAFAADVSVPILALTTRGFFNDDSIFTLGTRGQVELLIAGGFKFGGEILMEFESDDLEDTSSEENLAFRGAKITMRNPLGLPLDLAYFTGENDVFGAGDLFPDYFGARAIASSFRGYLYFPDPDQVRYDGIHTVSGTGLKISTSFLTDWNTTTAYIYQDTYLGTGNYSADLWTSINSESFKLEAFVGASFPASTLGYWRAGLLLFYDTGQGGEFLTQIGIPRLDPANDEASLDLFYLLFEPRISFGVFSIILTLFWHPEYYLQIETGEVGSADINAKFQFGRPNESVASGGVEAKLGFSSTGDDQFSAIVAPYISVITSGVVWDFKVNTKVFPFALNDLVEIFVSVRAEY